MAATSESLRQVPDPRFVSDRADDADLEAEVAQRAAHVALDVHQLALHELAAGQQHPLFLGNQRLHMHRLEQADAHHLRYSACIVAVRLVDLLGLQQRLHVPRFHTHDRQVCLRQPVTSHCDSGPASIPILT